ncbi:MAG TPA: GNAT family N-acetyltransferase, partial [Candidatus Bathyarchaeia archaeon]|nr:GNAT family N-acetyltransferase [Candidatus Bathyarchaeia archaeon]
MRKINLKGKVVALRPLRPSDSSRIYELVIDPEILRNTTIPTHYTLASAEEFARSSGGLWRRGTMIFAITLEVSEELVGVLELEVNATHKRGGLGY